MAVLAIVLLLVAAYLLGSIPTGYLVAKGVKGIDIRQYGSGGTGATNVLRTVGKGAAIAVLIIDLLKGLMAVLLVALIWPQVAALAALDALWQPWVAVGAGLLALVGHSKSVWINFSGGKSVASGLGVLIGLAWPVAVGAAIAFALALALSRIVSLSSIVAAIAASLLMVITGQPLPYAVLGALGALYVILRHRSNIDRLLAGTEPRLGQQSSDQSG
ncbi:MULTISPECIES: glycerol-3-phosphate 1-O-acyltransferase PlsY [Cyanophyceae]|uniref:glycerol-3-phosphate 1-O-acyltransferase PlsY n=1 Tax=Cyanophyceae TaxID=3028117 RepID=UPI0016869429|nr:MULTISPECIES: glycerol-3-phosphate 1-O-acyltransferase PlsY [Cyanophyceae]MBD1918117.1 glycerol-3-phosphate 1-O-acyltransferase PlsY [Phormidium sp. FACHB-77]MBD2030149.1 glycerol-3-phosphate 1-O-acyltransferase PlsY [Phormidium sp. FACHB-322]MBD2051479.1 glycerol-3-phosphate 1-O-acyltransferase PlsY [Leptolyngbya sp. FACHB-60]